MPSYGYTTTTPNTSAIDRLIQEFTQAQTEARTSTQQRQAGIEAIYDEIIERYGPGGTFGASAEAAIERQKVRDVSAAQQTGISSGTYGIRPYGAEWEATTGAQARLSLEDLRMERLSGAQLGRASFMERITDQYPDYSSLMQAISSMSSVGPVTSSYGSRPSGPLTSLPSRVSEPTTESEFDWDAYRARGGYTGPYGGGGTTARATIPTGQGYGSAGATGTSRQVDYLRDFNTYESYAAAASAAGLVAGPRDQWVAARRRIGLSG